MADNFLPSSELARVCVADNRGTFNWKFKMAASMMRRYRDITMNAVTGLKTIPRNGQLVYTLLGPPLHSPIGKRRMRFIFRDMMAPKTVIEGSEIKAWGSRTPHIGSLAFNYNCQCRCEFCFAGSYEQTPAGRYLTREEIGKFFQQAVDLGTTTFILGGGEALLRSDLAEIVAALDKSKATITLFTNGEFLTPAWARQLADAGIYGIFVSVDFADAGRHDRSRNRPGLYDKALEAIRNCQDAGVLVGISTVCTSETISDGSVAAVMDLARELDVFEVFVLDVVATGRLIDREQVILTPDERRLVGELVDRYSQDPSYPNVIHESMLFKLAYPCVQGCPAGTIMFHLRADGTVSPCDFMPRDYGNVRDEPLSAIWNRVIRDTAFASTEASCRMNNVSFRRQYISLAPQPAECAPA